MQDKLIIFSFTENGSRQSAMLQKQFLAQGHDCESYAVARFAKQYQLEELPANLSQWIGGIWGQAAFLFIGAAGIAIRYISPWVRDKYTDSAVLSMDEEGRFVIPLLSGHVGGAVALARQIAAFAGAVPVITTATDVQGKFAVDVFAVQNQLHISDRELARLVSAALLEGREIGFYSQYPVRGNLPEGLRPCPSPTELEGYPVGIAITDEGSKVPEHILWLAPQNLVIGIGCRRGLECHKLQLELEFMLRQSGLSQVQAAVFASIDLKKDEAGILELAEKYRVPFITYQAEELREITAVSSASEFVEKVTGVDNVCERAAKKYCPDGELLLPKQKMTGATFAVIRKNTIIHF